MAFGTLKMAQNSGNIAYKLSVQFFSHFVQCLNKQDCGAYRMIKIEKSKAVALESDCNEIRSVTSISWNHGHLQLFAGLTFEATILELQTLLFFAFNST